MFYRYQNQHYKGIVRIGDLNLEVYEFSFS